MWVLKNISSVLVAHNPSFPIQFSSVSQTLCDPMDYSTPGLPVHHQLPEFTQSHVRWVGDAIQPSHPLSSPSPAFNLSQHQGLFKWVSSSRQVAQSIGVSALTSVLPTNIQDWFPLGFIWIFIWIREPKENSHTSAGVKINLCGRF